MSEDLPIGIDDGLPVFQGTSFEQHVSTWRTVDESMESHLWMLGAIAASVEKKYGEDATGRFAEEVNKSRQTIRRFASTYREWEKRSALSVLTFHHHTIAARDPAPEEIIALARDKHWSTRELESAVKDRRKQRGGAAKYGKRKEKEQSDKQDQEQMMICPRCEGSGYVPYRGDRK